MNAAGRVATGFSKPYVAKYSNVGTTISYSEGIQLARGFGTIKKGNGLPRRLASSQ